MCHCRSRGSSAILPPYLCRYFVSSKFFLVSILWVPNFFSLIFCGYEIFSCEYFMDPKFFLVCISWLRNFSLWVFCGSKIFSRGYFVGPKFYFVGVSCVQDFFSWLILWFKDFQLLAAWERITEMEIQKFISNHVFLSKSISTIANSVYIRKVLRLINHLRYYITFICTNCSFSHLFSTILECLHL